MENLWRGKIYSLVKEQKKHRRKTFREKKGEKEENNWSKENCLPRRRRRRKLPGIGTTLKKMAEITICSNESRARGTFHYLNLGYEIHCIMVKCLSLRTAIFGEILL